MRSTRMRTASSTSPTPARTLLAKRKAGDAGSVLSSKSEMKKALRSYFWVNVFLWLLVIFLSTFYVQTPDSNRVFTAPYGHNIRWRCHIGQRRQIVTTNHYDNVWPFM
ncbi:unnamed protein product [Fusarium graminearum]|nr:unnamed protein product [Fusarium graminearum]